MKFIKQQLDNELSKDKPNKRLVSMFERLLDTGYVSIMDFRDTGRFVPAEVFAKESGNKLLPDTTEVVVYFNQYYIEVCKPDMYVKGPVKSRDLKEVENYLWESVQKVINN